MPKAVVNGTPPTAPGRAALKLQCPRHLPLWPLSHKNIKIIYVYINIYIFSVHMLGKYWQKKKKKGNPEKLNAWGSFVLLLFT